MIFTNSRLIKLLLKEAVEILILTLISITVTYMFAESNIFANISVYLNSIFYGFIIGWSVWKGNQILNFLLARKLNWRGKPGQTLFYRISASVIFTAIDIIIVNYLMYRYIFHVNFFDKLQRYIYYAIAQFGIAMLITTIFYVKHFFLSWKKLVVQEEKFKHEALSLQYETLKSYVNPHFLFNSLSVLSSLVEQDTVKSQQFIKQLSNIYRYVLEQKDKELVELSTELSFAQSFIELHKIRYGKNLRVDVQIDDLSGYIIPLSMQILLENAIKHNVISDEEPLYIKIWRDDDYIVVRNKIQKRKTVNQSSSIGLDTIKKRYEYFSPKLIFIENDDVFFTVKLPILIKNFENL